MAISHRILVADASRHTRGMICDVVRAAGHRDAFQASAGQELLKVLDQQRPRIVIVSADLPGLSGIEVVRRIRAGFNFVPRETSVILTTAAPTKALLDLARTAGVDELVAVPFTMQALNARLHSVTERPRPFIDCPSYVGPCRRRLMMQDYKGPRRRSADPAAPVEAGPLWSKETNRAAVRLCVQKMSEFRTGLSPEHYRKLKDIYQSVTRVETLASQDQDETLGEAARSFGRHIASLDPGAPPEVHVTEDHIDMLFAIVAGSDASLARDPSLAVNANIEASRSREAAS